MALPFVFQHIAGMPKKGIDILRINGDSNLGFVICDFHIGFFRQ